MTTLGHVKINGAYDHIETSDPTVAEKAPSYSAGDRWLNVESGDSFVLSDATLGTWTQIERALDYRIDLARQPTYERVIASCARALLIPRQSDVPQTTPDSIAAAEWWTLRAFVSVYAAWTIAGASISSDTITGDLEAFEYEDEAYIFGSRRNDGVKQIESVNADGLTFAAPLIAGDDRMLVSLIRSPVALDLIIGRMIWYDVTVRGSSLGLSSERIGTYGYTKSETVAGVEYPSDVVAGIGSYLNGAPIVDAEYTP